MIRNLCGDNTLVLNYQTVDAIIRQWFKDNICDSPYTEVRVDRDEKTKRYWLEFGRKANSTETPATK